MVVSATAQTRITYKLKSKDLPVVGEAEYIAKTREAAESFVFYLDIQNDKSHFYFLNEMAVDTDQNPFHRNMAIAMHVGGEEFWTDKSTGKQVVKTQNRKNVVSALITPQWKITDETKKIDKYDCFKAEYVFNYMNSHGFNASRTITAWFAPEIPFSFGPSKFFGLPGLILELDDDFMTVYVATSVETKINLPQINLPKDTVDKTENDKQAKETMERINSRK